MCISFNCKIISKMYNKTRIEIMCNFFFYLQGIRTIRVDANGYYTSIKSINIQDAQPQTIIFKLKKDERILNMPRMVFIALTGIQEKEMMNKMYLI